MGGGTRLSLHDVEHTFWHRMATPVLRALTALVAVAAAAPSQHLLMVNNRCACATRSLANCVAVLPSHVPTAVFCEWDSIVAASNRSQVYDFDTSSLKLSPILHNKLTGDLSYVDGSLSLRSVGRLDALTCVCRAALCRCGAVRQLLRLCCGQPCVRRISRCVAICVCCRTLRRGVL
jgi:hypothetical protein